MGTVKFGAELGFLNGQQCVEENGTDVTFHLVGESENLVEIG